MENENVLRLFDLYVDDAFRLAYSYLGSRPEAEDIVQDVFVKLIKSEINIAPGKEKSYLLTMIANACRDYFRSGAVTHRAPFDDAVGTDMEPKTAEEDTEMFYAVAKLPEKFRVVIHLHYYEGYTIKEIADILNLTASAVSMRLTRAKENLRKHFKGGTDYAG